MEYPSEQLREEAKKSFELPDGTAVTVIEHCSESLFRDEKYIIEFEGKIKSFTSVDGRELDEMRGRMIRKTFFIGQDNDLLATTKETWDAKKNRDAKAYAQFLNACEAPKSFKTEDDFDFINGTKPTIAIRLKTVPKKELVDGTWQVRTDGSTKRVFDYYRYGAPGNGAEVKVASNGHAAAVKRVVPRAVVDDEDDD